MKTIQMPFRLYYSAPKLDLVFSFLTKDQLIDLLIKHGNNGHVDVYNGSSYVPLTDSHELYEVIYSIVDRKHT